MHSKVVKKLNRAIHLLKRHIPDVRVSTDIPSEILYVANSGVVCGVTHNELYDVFSLYGSIKSVHVFAHKPYSFVHLANVESAQKAVKELQGVHPKAVAKEDVVFYLAFLQEYPSGSSEKPTKIPEGGILLEDFISEDEAIGLWNIVESRLRKYEVHDGPLKHRQVLHFGYTFSYETHSALVNGPFPEQIPDLCEKILDRICESNLAEKRPDQLTVNVYQAGQGIPFHTDTHSAFEDAIISISILSPVIMEFLEPESDIRSSVLLPGRSLLIMKDSARYQWKHGISPRKYDTLPDGKLLKRSLRCSFTFRAVRRRPCQCAFPKFCDWPRSVNSFDEFSVEQSSHNQLESQHVAEVYDAIASHFDSTRHSQWPGVKKFMDSLSAGDVILDVGCGNGKYLMDSGKGLIKIGCDLSEALCEICRKKNCETVVSNCLSLPFASEKFDASLSIAVIHHLSSEERRKKAISEQLRILRLGGKALIFVWAMEQNRDSKKSAYLKTTNVEEEMNLGVSTSTRTVCTESGKLDLVIHKNRKNFSAQDLLVPWELNKNCCKSRENNKEYASEKNAATNKESEKRQFLRFYHVFKENELEDLCKQLPGCEIVSSFYEQGNWCVILEKV